MKKHLSVFTLIAHHSIYKVMLLLLVMVGAEIGIYLWCCGSSNPDAVDISWLIQFGRLHWIFFAALLLLTAILTKSGHNLIGEKIYTMQRLSISEKAIFFWLTLYHSLCFLMVWALQAGLIFTLCSRYYADLQASDSSLLLGQNILLIFYSLPFLHGLVPLENTIGWYANLACIVGLGFTTAWVPFQVRIRKYPGTATFMLCCAILLFSRENGAFLPNVGLILASLLSVFITLYSLYFSRKEG